MDSQISRNPFLTIGKQIAYCHHERWDGTGYPSGLKGKEIPLSARIVSIADVYDALTSNRPYKKAFTHEEAVDMIKRTGANTLTLILLMLYDEREAFKRIKLFVELERDPQSISTILEERNHGTEPRTTVH